MLSGGQSCGTIRSSCYCLTKSNRWEFDHRCSEGRRNFPTLIGRFLSADMVSSYNWLIAVIKSMGDLIPLGEYCLSSPNVFSHHCPDVVIDSERNDKRDHMTIK